MPVAIDLTGHVYSRLTVIDEFLPRVRVTRWNCICDCGNTLMVIGNNLRRGNTTSCGCFKKEKTTKHGEWGNRLYWCYRNMLNRCGNPNHTEYFNYGARGISVCQEWLSSFDVYKQWSIKNGYGDSLTMDRIDGSKGYTPENCRWATTITQARNKRKQLNNTSGFIGVSKYKVDGTYQSSITVDRLPIYLGRYPTPLEAAQARDAYIKENLLEAFTLNFK